MSSRPNRDARSRGRYAVLAVLMALLVAAAMPVAARAEEHGCASSSFCMYQNIGFGGTKWQYTIEANNQNQWLFVGSGANDQASSIVNNRVHSTEVDKDYNPISISNVVCFSGGQQVSLLTERDWPDLTTMNDSISAYDLVSENPC